MTDKTRNGLIVLAEELGEVQKGIFKALRFGLHDRKPVHPLTNLQSITEELGDVLGAFKNLYNAGEMPYLPDLVTEAQIDAKVKKIEAFYRYSVVSGNA